MYASIYFHLFICGSFMKTDVQKTTVDRIFFPLFASQCCWPVLQCKRGIPLFLHGLSLRFFKASAFGHQHSILHPSPTFFLSPTVSHRSNMSMPSQFLKRKLFRFLGFKWFNQSSLVLNQFFSPNLLMWKKYFLPPTKPLPSLKYERMSNQMVLMHNCILRTK